MNRSESEHLAQFSKEALEIISEFNETERLMREQNAEGLRLHSQRLEVKYPLEAAVYNFTHPYPPYTLEQTGETCKEFLRGILFAKAGETALRKLSS